MARLLDLLEVARRLSVSPWTARRLIRDGRLRAANVVRGKTLVAEAELERFIAEAQGGPAAPGAAVPLMEGTAR